MARVTVEDCIVNVPNRFELVELAAQRAKDIASGSPLTIDRDRDKDAVVALREIADLTIPLETLREEVILSYQRQLPPEKASESDEDAKALRSEVADELSDAQKTTTEEARMDDDEGGMSFADENLEVED